MKSVEQSCLVAKKRTDKKVLRELVAQVKEWKKEHKGTSAELYLQSPGKTMGNLPQTESDYKKRVTDVFGIAPRANYGKEQSLTPKTLQRIEAGNKFTLMNGSSHGEFSNDEFTIDHDTVEKEPRYKQPFTMGNTAIQSRGSPRRVIDKAAYSPATLSDLNLNKGFPKEQSFSKLCDFVQIKGLREDRSENKAFNPLAQSHSPYTLGNLSNTEEYLGGIRGSPRSGSATAKRLESAAGMQAAIDKRHEEKLRHLQDENGRLRESNERYVSEIAALGRRIEALAAQMHKESLEDSRCSVCRCGHRADIEDQAKKILRLEQNNASLQAKLKLSLNSLPRQRSPSEEHRLVEMSPGEIATSRLRSSKHETILESEKKRALSDLAAMSARCESLERENIILKQSRIL